MPLDSVLLMMVPLQAEWRLAYSHPNRRAAKHTELLLDDLENLLVVELGRDTLNGGQGLTSITLCDTLVRLEFSDTAIGCGEARGSRDKRAAAGHRRNIR